MAVTTNANNNASARGLCPHHNRKSPLTVLAFDRQLGRECSPTGIVPPLVGLLQKISVRYRQVLYGPLSALDIETPWEQASKALVWPSLYCPALVTSNYGVLLASFSQLEQDRSVGFLIFEVRGQPASVSIWRGILHHREQCYTIATPAKTNARSSGAIFEAFYHLLHTLLSYK